LRMMQHEFLGLNFSCAEKNIVKYKFLCVRADLVACGFGWPMEIL